MSSRKKRTFTTAEKRALALSPGLVVTRYAASGERATVHQLGPDGEESSWANNPMRHYRRGGPA